LCAIDSLEVNLESVCGFFVHYGTLFIIILLAWSGLCDAVLVAGIATGVREGCEGFLFPVSGQFLNLLMFYELTVFTRSVFCGIAFFARNPSVTKLAGLLYLGLALCNRYAAAR
jgi:hypothetical protein